MLSYAKLGMVKLRETNIKLEFSLKFVVDADFDIKKRLQLLNVQIQGDLKLKDDENGNKRCVLQNQVQELNSEVVSKVRMRYILR